MESVVTLYRPTGPQELALVAGSGWRRWPPRLPEQPIFYPVSNEVYAREIAERWNVKESGSGFVTRFAVRMAFLTRYEPHVVGAREHEEYWIPAEELEALNDAIVGEIEVIVSFGPAVDAPTLAVLRAARGKLDPVGLAEVVRRLAPGGLAQSTLVAFFERAFVDIPLRALLAPGAWHRVSAGGLTDAGFIELLAPWLGAPPPEEGLQGPAAPDARDWRLHGQDGYLRGKAWTWQEHTPHREGWDHDHCEMCSTKLAPNGVPDVIHAGYSTEDGHHWVCPPCFEDFRAAFAWTVAGG